MKNMVLLIDANVIISYITNRNPGFAEAYQIMDCCREGRAKGFIAFHTVSILWYVLRKKPKFERRSILLSLCELFTVTGASHQDVVDAVTSDDFSDFEDCLQEKCAENVGADYIVTEKIRDFKTSKVPAATPADMLAILSSKKNDSPT